MNISRSNIAALACAALLLACQRDSAAPLAHVQQLNDLAGDTRDLALELREGTNMAATPSPDGERIVFSMQGALWIMPVTGGNAQRITGWELEATHPVWSPDGASIAFQNFAAEGNYQIWRIDPDGRGAQALTSGPYDDREPAWAPDGSALVFASDRGNDGQVKIWRLALGEREPEQVTQGAGAESDPALSPDGKHLAYADSGRIYTLALGQAAAAPVAVAAGSAPAWSLDGKTLVYQNLGGQLMLGGREITSNEDVFPFPVRWLPDGRLLYTADGKIRLRQAAGGDPAELPFEATMLVRRPGSTRSRERGFGDRQPRPVQGISAPVLSPDGASIAFIALNDVWVMPIGQAPQRLTMDPDRDCAVQWSADGSAVYFASERGNGGYLAVDQVQLASRARTRLAALPGRSMENPRRSPDGTRIAFTESGGQLALWDVARQSAQVVAQGVGSEIGAPSWTADGRHLAVVANERANNRFHEGFNKLRVTSVETGQQRHYALAPAPAQITDLDEGGAVISPDGAALAFIMDSVLHVMPLNADGSPAGEAIRLTAEAADLPSWSGDGRTILYKSASRLKLVAAAGGAARVVPVALDWTQDAPPGTLLIRAGALWDGVSPTLARDVDILITGNRISAIRPRQEGAETAATRFLDASHLTLMPGLWDSGVLPGARAGSAAAAMLAYGITSLQSGAAPLHQSTGLREALAAGNMVGPRLFVAAPPLGGNRVAAAHARSVRTSYAANLEIAKATRMGVDAMAADVRAPVAIMQRVAQGALTLGVPSGARAAAPALSAGIGNAAPLAPRQRMGYDWSRSALLAVGYQDAHDLYANGELRLADSLPGAGALAALDPGVSFDPRLVLAPPGAAAALRSAPPMASGAMAAIRRDAQQQARVIAAGALVSNGSAAAGPAAAPGLALHLALRAAGTATTAHQALQTVTINAARLALVERDLGTVEEGKLADLIAVRGDPLRDLGAAANVDYVIKNGNLFTPAQILAPFRLPAALPCATDPCGALSDNP